MLAIQTQTKMEVQKAKNDDFSVIILLYKNQNFGKSFSKPFDLELCGKKMWKWVEKACHDYHIKTTLCTQKSNVLDLIKPMLTKSKYTLVLYSDTPLLSKKTVDNIFAYASENDVEEIKLTRGYLFNTEYAKRASKLPEQNVQHFDDEDFTTIFDLRQFEFVNQILKNQIIEFHQKNGVCIMDNQTTFIDADCEIESGVIIYPQNSILGNSYIAKNAILNSGNVVIASTIGEGAVLNGAYIKNTNIKGGQEVKAFERIIGK